MSENTPKECIGATAIQCPRLPENRGATPEALVRLFRDGSTSVLCTQNNDGKCKKNEGQSCDFERSEIAIDSANEYPDNLPENTLAKLLLERAGGNPLLAAHAATGAIIKAAGLKKD